MKIVGTVDSVISSIRTNPLYKEMQYKYWYCDSLTPGGILFVGINPSEEKKRKCEDVECHTLLQKGNNHPYFTRFEKTSSECNIKWTHVDLLFYRGNEKEFDKILKKNNGRTYINEQLQISKQLIELSKPKLVVVANALACKIFKKDGYKGFTLGYDLTFDEKIGTYLWNKIPVFLSGMLSGQHALDTGSYERLNWHIKEVLKKINSQSKT